ncbi:MAG: diacylglycerol kinase family protein [Candidatus Zixiibacteriota bacterium]
MIRKRQRRVPSGHYALLVNRRASNYEPKAVEKLVASIRAAGQSYTIYEPETAVDLLRQAEVAAGQRQASAAYPRPYERGGKVTALVACGGDGTFNLVARVGQKADLPVGQLPLGKTNNVALSFYGTSEPSQAIKNILSSGARATNVGLAGNLPFFGSVGLGFAPKFIEELAKRPLPRFTMGWSQLGAKVAAQVTLARTVVKVDAFRFEIQPIILNVNILSHSMGLPLTLSSVPDDGQIELVFDAGLQAGHFSSFTRLIRKKQYLYSDEFRLFRGREISVEPVAGRMMYLDGELIELPTDLLEIRIDGKKLQVLS